jgi:UDP-N-acetyl-D-mannosaminuronic acid dehydrogenase
LPSVLNLNAQELVSVENRLKYPVSVVGCGFYGIVYANAFAGAGFKVVCADADQSVLKRLAKGKSEFADLETEKTLKNHLNSGQITVSSDIKEAVKQSGIVVLTVPVKIDDRKSPDYSEVVGVCKQVGSALREGSIVIYGVISSVGFFEGTLKETLENTSGLKLGKSFCLAYVPYPTNPQPASENLEFTLSAADPASLNVASSLLSTLTKNVKQVSDIKVAELAQLVKAVKQDAQLALANELAVFCETAGLDYFEVAKLSQTEAPSILEEKNSSEVYLLLDSAENLNAKIRLPMLARQINEEMIKHGLTLTSEAMRNIGKTLRRAQIALFGSVNQQPSTEQFAKMLVLKGAKVMVYDPAQSKPEPSDSAGIVKKTLNEAVEGADCIVVLSGIEPFKRLNFKKLHSMMKSPAVIVDLVGAIDFQKAEAEGFIYQGLGRGLKKN